ncbi:restriction endonuclease subunit S [Stutzerimonas xanthomarina]|uniref:Restriction endonuclease subunit S n=1 Tax=Stutzerimonas xanthomarina TaxID=271420 RepID=A0A3R8VRM2_9GAMM|nr:restriction endonuclease subunit S [Stutzerimonas xanthomarina]RRV07700.1 restriction endonuclease subunit S [Stutzerimonas xanthomarina]
MTALLTDNLPLLAGAPNGIKKLRELILELAVRGKLVPQNPNDEPASELLKRIAAEKKGLSPKVKKSSDTPMGAVAFELPESWCWASFGDIAQHNSGKTLDKGKNSGVPRNYITTSNLYWGRFDLASVRQMLFEEKDLARCTAIKNDLLICEGGEAGRAAVWDQESEICFQNHVHRARFFGEINPYYAQRYFERLNYSGEIAEYRKGVGISNMSSKALASIPMPVPPLAEQHRIVAKVDELMALCDRLEAQQADAESAHAQLVQALLGSLTQATDAEDFAASWQRLAEHFHTLFTTESSIDALKQTLLQLAVMGKLVPQDPSDEPANELLKKITEEKARLVTEGELKKQKPLEEVRDDEALFELPSNWAWARFGNVCAIKGELVRPEDFPSLRQVAPDCIEKGTGRLTDNRTVKDSGVKGPNSRFFSGQIVYSKIRPSLSKAVLVDFDGLCSADMYPIDAFINPEFLLKEILSEVFLEQVRVAENRIKMPKLNQESLTGFVLPIPPLPEQHRIVAKVDQLMALCDQLKTRLTQARQLNEQLATALVEQAVA